MAKNIGIISFDDVEYSIRPYGVCSTDSGVAAKVVSINGFVLFEGATVLVKFENENTATNPTLNINNTGAKFIKWGENSPYIEKGATQEFRYNGDTWVLVSSTHPDTPLHLAKLSEKIEALAAGLKVTGSVSPTTIYKSTGSKITLTGTVADDLGSVEAETIEIKYGDTVYGTGNNKSSYSVQKTDFSITSNSAQFIVSATIRGMQFNTRVNIYARHPVYYGMGTKASDIKSNGTKAGARTSINGTYSGTASGNGQRFYLLVPSDITKPKSFSMGGAPVDMYVPTTTENLDGIEYYVCYTNGTYNSGQSVQINVS